MQRVRGRSDKTLFATLLKIKKPNLFQQSVDDLIVENDQVCGVVTQMGLKFKAAVVLTVVIFLAEPLLA